MRALRRREIVISITISCCDRLYLAKTESRRLAGRIRQQLVCRRTDQVDDPVVVADILVSPGEARRLADKLEASLMEETIDWAKEGF
jgi:hypothetical protein